MRKKDNILYGILFGLLMVLLFLPLLQERLGVFKFKPFSGVFTPTPKPELSFDTYANGAWQGQVETYLSKHFGFREPVIRFYNQYVYDFYHKTYNEEVAVGKDGWLYQKDGIVQYFGRMGQRHHLTNEEFENNLAIETRSLVKLRAILKEYGVELMTFTLPVKSYIYPEHLRPQRFIDTTFHADEYYDQKLREAGFPHINMTPWFQTIRNDYPFTLFYEKGSHWASGAVLACDSLFRFMETLKGDHLARIVMGTPYEVPEKDINPKDKDLARLLNILREPKQKSPLYEIPVTIEADSNTVYPSALFVGTSYFWYMTPRVPFEKVFSNRNLIFYNATYYSDEEKTIVNLDKINVLREVLNHDYVVYFKNAPQLYNDGFQFYGKTLIDLCISDKRYNEKVNEIADSLARYQPVEHWEQKDYLYYAKMKVLRNPELFEELRGTEVPTVRNPKVEKLLVERRIRKDRNWAFLLTCKAQHDTLDLDKVFEIESTNLLEGKPLVRDNVFFTPYDYFDFLVEERVGEMRRQPDNAYGKNDLRKIVWTQLDSLVDHHAFEQDSLMKMACAMGGIIQHLENWDALNSIRQKAKEQGITLDKMFRNDVLWIYKNRETSQYVTDEQIKTLFEYYKIERGLRSSQKSMDQIRQKAENKQEPFIVAMDQDVDWIIKNRQP